MNNDKKFQLIKNYYNLKISYDFDELENATIIVSINGSEEDEGEWELEYVINDERFTEYYEYNDELVWGIIRVIEERYNEKQLLIIGEYEMEEIGFLDEFLQLPYQDN
tara:strand:- start:15311 stop:15634 length:324 start_codon:yes stop_codon:yes gene_type:complete